MLQIPVEQIIEKIKEKTNLPNELIEERILQKMEQLSGLVSKEGAAYIVANEVGAKILAEQSGRLQIKNILNGMRSVELLCKITRVFELREFNTGSRNGKVLSLTAEDETGNVRIVLWNEKAENSKNLKEGDVIKISNGYVKENNGRKEVHMNDRSKIEINPEGETLSIPRKEIIRKKINELKENDDGVEITAAVVNVFDPRFFEVCSTCGKKFTNNDGDMICDKHGKVEGDFSYVMNAILDDGTETVRGVFFRNQIERALEMSHAEILGYKDDPLKLNELKNKLIGEQLNIVGKVNKNPMFDRLEFIAQLVNKTNPEEEIKKLEK